MSVMWTAKGLSTPVWDVPNMFPYARFTREDTRCKKGKLVILK